MELWHIDPHEYGSFGSVVIAANEERAIELFLSACRGGGRPTHLSATLLAYDLSKEFVQDEMLE